MIPYIQLLMESNSMLTVPCHHGMVCSQFAEEGVGLQIWRVSLNILNKQLVPSWLADGVLTAPHHKKEQHDPEPAASIHYPHNL
jgi:hypothetical protein